MKLKDRLLAYGLLLATVVLLLHIAACPNGCQGTPGTVTGKVMNCSSQAVQDHWATLLPQVNSCLVMPTNWEGCLLGLIAPAAGVTEEVIACLVRDQQLKMMDAARANPNDSFAAIGAGHAQAYLEQHGYTFKE